MFGPELPDSLKSTQDSNDNIPSVIDKSLPSTVISHLKDHKGAIYALTSTSNGNFVLSGGKDKIIRLWNPFKELLIKSYKGHGYDIQALAINNNNNNNDTFASAGGDRSIFIWDVSTGKNVRKFRGHSLRINCLQYNSEYSVIGSGSEDQTVLLFDLKDVNRNRKPLMILKDCKGTVTDICMNGYSIFVASIDGYLRTYDIRKGKLISDFICKQGLTSIHLSKDEKCMLVSCLDSKLRLMNIFENGSLLNSYSGHRQNEYRLHSHFGFGDNDEYIVTGDENGEIWIWHMVDNQEKCFKIIETENNKKNAMVTNVIPHPTKANVMFSSDIDGVIKIWN